MTYLIFQKKKKKNKKKKQKKIRKVMTIATPNVILKLSP